VFRVIHTFRVYVGSTTTLKSIFLIKFSLNTWPHDAEQKFNLLLVLHSIISKLWTDRNGLIKILKINCAKYVWASMYKNACTTLFIFLNLKKLCVYKELHYVIYCCKELVIIVTFTILLSLNKISSILISNLIFKIILLYFWKFLFFFYGFH